MNSRRMKPSNTPSYTMLIFITGRIRQVETKGPQTRPMLQEMLVLEKTRKQLDGEETPQLLVADDHGADLESRGHRSAEAGVMVASDNNAIGAFTPGVSQRTLAIGWV
jgi:hypothetical protein